MRLDTLESELDTLNGSRRRRGAPASSRGFTFVELVLVIGIIALLLGMTVASIHSTRQNYQIYTAGITFSGRLAEARTQALKRNRPINVTLDGTARTFTTTYTPPGGTAVVIGGPEFLPTGITFDLGGAATLVVTFDSMGRPLNPPQSFQLRQASSGRVRNISVLSTGRITVN
jgi:prepilin-type N-terminal cleavage/methylation domain-containing protein